LPTQLADSPFDFPQSVLVIFREYPFAQYQISVAMKDLAAEKTPHNMLLKVASEFTIEQI